MSAPRFSSCWARPIVFALLAVLIAASAHAQTIVARTLRNTGPNSNRVNVAILGDGFTEAQQEQFFAAAQAKLNVLVNNESFAASKDILNGVAVFTASNESGTDIAADGITRDTYYDTGFSGSVNARLLTVATSAGRTRATNILREHAPDYDISIVLVNTTIYGGAGGTLAVASLHNSSDEVLLHEIGHSFAKLADEYVDAISAPNYPPAESANATQKTARAELAWIDFLLDSTAVPTPNPSPTTNTDANFVGHWEGAHYRATGFYRPVFDSKMRTLGRPFGPVNLRAYAKALHRLNLNNATTVPGSFVVTAPTARASAGGALALAVTTDGVGPLTYQWIHNGKFIAGKTDATLSLTNISAAQAGTYAVEVTNAVGEATTAAAGIFARVVAQGTGGSATYEVQIGTQSVVRWVSTTRFVSEQSGSVVLTLSRSGSGTGAMNVTYATASGTATAPGDFTAQSGTVRWADGDVADKTVTIAVANDGVTEGLESFTVTLGTPTAGILVGTAVATVTLADSGTRDPSFNANFINNTVNRILLLPDGSTLIGGAFTTLQDAFFLSYPLNRVARLKSDGLIDPSFKPGTGADGTIQALARQADGKILIGGDFQNYDGTPRARIARINPNGSLDPSFAPGTGANGLVYDILVLPDGKLLVAGAFTNFNGTPREYLVRLNADGSVDPSFSGPDFGGTASWWTRSLALLPDGRVLVAGVFFFTGTNARGSICRINANGSLDPTFDGVVQGASAAFTGNSLGELRKVAVLPDGKILIAGTLITYNQASRRGIARLAANGALDASFDPGTGGDQAVDTFLAQSDGKIMIGGRFTSFNGTPVNRIARLNTDGSIDGTFTQGVGFSNFVSTLVEQPDGNVLAGGGNSTFQGSSLTRPVWRFLAGSGAPVSTTPTQPQTPDTPVSVDPGRLVNLSVRTELASANDNFTFGLVVGGAGTVGTKALMVRAVGPSLSAFGLTGVLADPKLDFYTGPAKVGENDNWGGAATVRTAMAQVGAFAFTADNSRDAALLLPTLPTGNNSVIISGTGSGTVLAELYDATPSATFSATTPRLVNVSVLKHLGTGVIAGFVIGGSTPRMVLIRAIGPTLGAAPFNVGGVVADPQMTLFSGSSQIAANDNWGGTAALTAAFSGVGAFALPANSRDAALVTTLQPGGYTVQVSGVANTTGVALVEVYEVP